MAPRSKGKRLGLGDPIQTMLADFCAAQHNATERTVIRSAVKAYIEEQLRRDAATRERYEAILAARSSTTDQPL
jgi:hypothetical protein